MKILLTKFYRDIRVLGPSSAVNRKAMLHAVHDTWQIPGNAVMVEGKREYIDVTWEPQARAKEMEIRAEIAARRLRRAQAAKHRVKAWANGNESPQEKRAKLTQNMQAAFDLGNLESRLDTIERLVRDLHEAWFAK